MTHMNRDEVKARIEAGDARVASALDEMRASHAELRADLKAGMAAFSTELEKMKSEFHASFATHTKWIAVMVFATVTAATTLFGWLKPTPAATFPAQLAPYVIYAQPPSSTPATEPTRQTAPRQP